MFFPVNGDPYYDSVSLLLPMTGANNSTTFTDVSPSPKTITRVGDTKILAAQSKWGQGSGYFDGTGDYLSFASQSTFGFSVDDFTVECWIKKETGADFVFLDTRINASDSGVFFHNSTGLGYYDEATGSIQSSALLSVSWSHVVFVRSSGALKIFLNGVNSKTSPMSANMGLARPARIGASFNATLFSAAYLQDFRVTLGMARYTNDFSVPSGPLSSRLPENPVRQIVQPSFHQVARLGL